MASDLSSKFGIADPPATRLAPVSMDKEVAETLQTALTRELFPDMVNKSEKFGQCLNFVNQPVRQTERVKVDSAFLVELEQEVVKDIEIMKQRITDGDVSSEDGRPVEVLDPRFFHPDPELPPSIRMLLLYMHWKLRIPADCHCNIRVYIGKRQARTSARPPSPEHPRVCRIVTHFGPDDVYKLSEILINGQYGDSTEYTMVNGASLLLDKNYFTNHSVYVAPNPRITFPSSIPSDVDIEAVVKAQTRMMKGVGGRRVKHVVDTSRIAKMTQRMGIRARRYVRLAVVMDFGPSVYIKEDKILEVARTVNNVDAPDFSGGIPAELPEHIRAQLPPEIRGIVTSSSGRLNKKVSEIGRKVHADLSHRPELYTAQPNISEDFITDVASSTIRNIDIDDVRSMDGDIEKVARAAGIDGTQFDPETRRKMRREERKSRRPRRTFTSDASSSASSASSSSSSASSSSALSSSAAGSSDVAFELGDVNLGYDVDSTSGESGPHGLPVDRISQTRQDIQRESMAGGSSDGIDVELSLEI